VRACSRVGDEGMGEGCEKGVTKGLKAGMTKRAKGEDGREPYLISRAPEEQHTHSHRLAAAVG
jgi:hypothetical protein